MMMMSDNIAAAEPATTTPEPNNSNAAANSGVESPSPEIELELADGVRKKFKPEQIINVIRNYEALQKKAQEYESSNTQMDNLLANLKENPSLIWDFAESLGHDPKELTKSKFQEYLSYEKMTPEEKRIYELERKLKGYEYEKQTVAEKQKQDQYNQAVEKGFQQIQNEFNEFYQKNPNIKPSKWFAQDIVNIQRIGLEQTGKRPSVSEAFEIYKQKENYYKQSILNSISEENFPDELLRIARKKLSKQTRNFVPPHQAKISSKNSSKKTKGTKKGLTINDFFG